MQERKYNVILIYMKPDPFLTVHTDPITKSPSLFFDDDVSKLPFVNFAPQIEVVIESTRATSESEAIELLMESYGEKYSEDEGWVCLKRLTSFDPNGAVEWIM